jgi:hypothetical protein
MASVDVVVEADEATSWSEVLLLLPVLSLLLEEETFLLLSCSTNSRELSL